MANLNVFVDGLQSCRQQQEGLVLQLKDLDNICEREKYIQHHANFSNH